MERMPPSRSEPPIMPAAAAAAVPRNEPPCPIGGPPGYPCCGPPGYPCCGPPGYPCCGPPYPCCDGSPCRACCATPASAPVFQAGDMPCDCDVSCAASPGRT